jgi:hypothetical protein
MVKFKDVSLLCPYALFLDRGLIRPAGKGNSAPRRGRDPRHRRIGPILPAVMIIPGPAASSIIIIYPYSFSVTTYIRPLFFICSVFDICSTRIDLIPSILFPYFEYMARKQTRTFHTSFGAIPASSTYTYTITQ